MHPLGRTFPRWGKAQFVEELRTKEQAETDRKVQESLDNFIRQTMGQEPYASLTKLPGWPLLSPPKVQMQKCEKCALEFCSTINHRRHMRIHRRSLAAENENLKKERPNVAAFWNKLTPDEAGQLFSLKNFKLEDLSGASAVKALSSLIKQHGFSSLPQPYVKAGVTLLDLVQNKVPTQTMTADELFSIMDNASEQTFLRGGTSLAVQRFVYHGEFAKHAFEDKNVVASVAFLLEHKLVKAWMVDKDAEALRFQRELVEEEEASQMRRQKLLERKRQKRLRQKVSKEKEKHALVAQLGDEVEEGDFTDGEGHNLKMADDCESPTGTASSSTSYASAGKHLESTGIQSADYSAEWDTMNAWDPIKGAKETFQSVYSSSYYGGLLEGTSFDLQPPQDADECPPDISPMHVSMDLHNGEVSFEDDLSNPLVGSDGQLKVEIGNRDERLRQLQLGDGERNLHNQNRQNGGWKGNEHESYSVHSRNHEVERSAFHHKNGRLIWERRSSVPFEKARITNEVAGNEERFRNSYSRQPGRRYRTLYSTFTNGTKGEHWPSSDFEGATGPRLQHYRPKLVRAKQAFTSTTNGYAVWTRKTETPAVLLDAADSSANFDSLNNEIPPKVDEKPVLSLVKSDVMQCSEEMLEKDCSPDIVHASVAVQHSSYSESSIRSTSEMPTLSNLQSSADSVICTSEGSSPCLNSIKEKAGLENSTINANHGTATAGELSGVVSLVPLTADSSSRDEHGHVDKGKSNALIIGSLSIPLSIAEENPLFQYVSHVPTETHGSQHTSVTSKPSENCGAIVEYRSEISSEKVEEMDKSLIKCESASVEVNSSLQLGKMEDKVVSHFLESSATDKLSKQMVGRPGTSKVWRAVGFVGDRLGANTMKSTFDTPISILSGSSNDEDTGNCLTVHYESEDGIDLVEGQVDWGDIVPHGGGNRSSGWVYSGEVPQHIITTYNREVEDLGLSEAVAIDEDRAKISWNNNSAFSPAVSSSFLSIRWEAAIQEVGRISRS